VSPRLFATTLSSSVDVFAVLLHYGEDKQDSGIALLPGELFGYRHRPDQPDADFVLRGNFAVDLGVLREFTTRLRDLALALRTRGAQIEARALKAARAVADVDAIVHRLRY
jgi:hypothetical protein